MLLSVVAQADCTLKLTWENPTAYEDGTPLEPGSIVAYEVWSSFQDADFEYAKWIPYSAEEDKREYTIEVANIGTYCFKMGTVAQGKNRSAKSIPACYTVTESDLNPVSPIQVIPLGPNEIKIICDQG